MKRFLSKEMQWLLRQARPLFPLYGVQMLGLLISSLLLLLDPLLIKWLIDDVLTWERASLLPVLSGTFFLVFLLQYAFGSASYLLDAYGRQRLATGVRQSLLKHLQDQSAAFFDQRTTGDLLHRLEQDVDQVCELSGSSLASLLRVTVTASLTLVILLALNWRLTLLVLPLLPIMGVLRQLSYKRLRQSSDVHQRATAARVDFLQDHLGAILQVQLLDRCRAERRRFFRLSRTSIESSVKRKAQELTLDLSTQLTVVAATAVVLGFGGHQVMAGRLTIGGLVAFYTYLSRLFGPAQTLIQLTTHWQRASASIRRIRELLAEIPQIQDAKASTTLIDAKPLPVELQSVGFRYPVSPSNTLEQCSLAIAASERVALVGPTGCGKSTITRLLCRQYDPQEGSVRLDGKDLRTLQLRELRKKVALVSQEPILFGTSLKENLLYGNPAATDTELHRVLEQLRLTELVSTLQDGWHTKLGSGAKRLSGGQRQRIAVAHAILQRPRLLILDEATSALDGTTERLVLEALDELAGSCTILLVAHRLSAIRWARRIVVLEEGRVTADGSHADLYRQGGTYRRLCDDQLRKECAWENTLRQSPTPILEAL